MVKFSKIPLLLNAFQLLSVMLNGIRLRVSRLVIYVILKSIAVPWFGTIMRMKH